MSIIFEYAVKFIQGLEREGQIVAPGEYWTAINVHNPIPRPIKIRKKVAVALPEDEERGPVSKFVKAELQYDEALEIDRDDIIKILFPKGNQDPQRFIKGFVVIQSDVELDVVAVYTAADENQQIKALHTERVLPRRSEV